MNQVITAEQAKKITGGRTPLVPVEYEAAVTALQSCTTLDESKYWADKADALAAWARIYRDDKAGLESKRLKLHAYRRMGQLAAELQPGKIGGKRPGGFALGATPGPAALLMSKGLSENNAGAARFLAKLPKKDFSQILARPTAPATARINHYGEPAWQSVRRSAAALRSYCRQHDPKELARNLSAGEVSTAKSLVSEITEWLDAFDRALPKTPKG